VIVNARAALWFTLAATCFSQTWDPDRLGNHRAVLSVTANAAAVRAHIPWRRRDSAPEKKSLIVIDARTGNEISNVMRIEINREFGDIAFEPASGPGTYFVYYLPYASSGRTNYPTITYPEWRDKASPEWLARVRPAKLPQATFVAMQSIDEFNSFSPMEVIATSDEVQALLARYPERSYFVFPEERSRPIRMSRPAPVLGRARTRATIQRQGREGRVLCVPARSVGGALAIE
jgi:hypothetical protein